MQTARIVETGGIQNLHFGFHPVSKPGVSYSFGFEAAGVALNRRIIPAVSLAVHVRHAMPAAEPLLVIVAAILAAMVRVVQQAGGRILRRYAIEGAPMTAGFFLFRRRISDFSSTGFFRPLATASLFR